MKTTVDLFILGAGASKSYGFPTGEELRQQAIEELSPGAASELMVQVVRLGPNFGYSKSDVEAFRDALAASMRNHSIDAFIESRANSDDIGKLSAIAKVVIAILIMRCEKDEHLKATESWYEELFNRLYEGNKTFTRFLENKVEFITFNYDRSLERYLQLEVAKEFEVEEEAAAKQLGKSYPVIHPHGSLGKLWGSAQDSDYRSYTSTHTDDEVIRAAGTVRLITDEIDIDNNQDFKDARKAILEARRVHFVGFGYNPDNMRRLGLLDKEAREFKNDKMFGTLTGVPEQKVLSYALQFKLNTMVGRNTDSYSLVRFPKPSDRAFEYMSIAPFA